MFESLRPDHHEVLQQHFLFYLPFCFSTAAFATTFSPAFRQRAERFLCHAAAEERRISLWRQRVKLCKIAENNIIGGKQCA